MAPRVLICGVLKWAHHDVEKLLGDIAEVVYMDSPDRPSFVKEFGAGGKYEGTIGIYRENSSANRIGIFDAELVETLARSVKWIAHNGAGYDQIDVQACKAKGIYVSNTPGAVDEATATTCLYLLLSTMRQYSLSERTLHAGKWKPYVADRTHDLSTRTVGILGLGGIGLYFANLVHAFPGVRIIYHNRKKHASAPAWCEYFSNVEEMLAQTDILSVHVPLNEQTVALVGESWIRKLKRGAIIVNTARGKVIDEEAMIRALEDGHISAIGLDVYPNEPEINPRLLEFPQNTLLPHMGTENQDSQHRMEVRAITNLKDFLETGKGKDLVGEYNSA